MSGFKGAECGKVREQLDSYLAKELTSEAALQIERHLADCPECAGELSRRAEWRAQLQAAVRATPVPARLESDVRQALRTRAASPRTGVWAVAAAAATVLICTALITLWRAKSDPEQAILRKTTGRMAAVLKVGLRDHLHCAVFRK